MTDKSKSYNIEIDQIGHGGDAVIDLEGDRYYLPYLAAGDEIEVTLIQAQQRHKSRARKGQKPKDKKQAKLLTIHHLSDQRQEPPCHHYGQCGGCVMQHIHDEAYEAWKLDILETTLRQRGLA